MRWLHLQSGQGSTAARQAVCLHDITQRMPLGPGAVITVVVELHRAQPEESLRFI